MATVLLRESWKQIPARRRADEAMPQIMGLSWRLGQAGAEDGCQLKEVVREILY